MSESPHIDTVAKPLENAKLVGEIIQLLSDNPELRCPAIDAVLNIIVATYFAPLGARQLYKAIEESMVFIVKENSKLAKMAYEECK